MLSVAFLVKNPPLDRLAMLIEYLRPIANEFVIVDTGSDERTISVMKSWVGVHIFPAPWENDFAKARNVGLPYCTNEWTLILDPDELPSIAMMQYIRTDILDSQPKDVDGVAFWTRNFWDGVLGPEAPYHWHTRIIRTGKAKFYRPVHELIEFDDGQSELSLRNTTRLPLAPREAYLIHSKGQEEIQKADSLYDTLGADYNTVRP